MRLLAALATGFFAYLIAGFLTGNAPSFRRSQPTTTAPEDSQALWLSQAGVDLTPRQFWAGSVAAGMAAFGLFLAFTGDSLGVLGSKDSPARYGYGAVQVRCHS